MLGAALAAKRKETDQNPIHNIVWEHFHHLSDGAKRSLHPFYLRRVLIKVVPSMRAIQRGVVDPSDYGKMKAWQSRLRKVLFYLHEAEDREAAKGHPIRPEPALYRFILRHLTLTGNLFATEQVIADMKERGIPLAKKVHELRLTSIAQWLRRRSEEHTRRELSKTFQPGQRFTSLMKLEPFFPEDAAILLDGLLADLRGEFIAGFPVKTLELLLRTAKEAGNEEAMVSILKDGFGVDLDFPDVQPDSMAANSNGHSSAEGDWNVGVAQAREEQNSDADAPPGYFDSAARPTYSYPPITSYALNTILDHLARRPDYWRTARSFEVLSQPLNAAIVPSNPVQAFLADLQAKTAASFVEELPAVGQDPNLVENSRLEDEDPPLTLSEAIAQEEASGQTIKFFGKTQQTSSDSVSQAEEAELTAYPAIPFSNFLSTVASPSQVVEAIQRQGDLSTLLDVLEVQSPLANSTSFSLLIRTCANAALTTDPSSTVNERENAANMAVHYLRSSVRNDMERRNAFLVSFAAIEEEAARRLQQIIGSQEGNLKGRREALSLWKYYRQVHLAYPPSLTSHKQAVAVYHMSQNAFWPRQVRLRLTDAAIKEARKVLRFQMDELHVLKGEPWKDVKDGRLTDARESDTAAVETTTFLEKASPNSQQDETPSRRSPDGLTDEPPSVKLQTHREPPARRLHLPTQISILQENIAALEDLIEKYVERGEKRNSK